MVTVSQSQPSAETGPVARPGPEAERTVALSEAQIKHMANRFLGWRLPENFHPDAGISFKAEFNENTKWPMKHQPIGTNLFDADQAEAMARHMVEGLPPTTSATPSERIGGGDPLDVVGHKTFRDAGGQSHHEPLTRAEADEMIAAAEAAQAKRATEMPTEVDAIRTMWSAHQRLEELGWNNAIYCPKDGTPFDAIEPGSTGIFRTYYSGKWPSGSWWAEDGGDLWPARPCLYRALSSEAPTPACERSEQCTPATDEP